MNITKTGNIEYKVFKKRDLKNLAEYFLEIKDELTPEDSRLEFEFNFEDGSSISGSDISILDETETKLVSNLRYSVSNYNANKKMYIYITKSGGNYTIESQDKDWVDARSTQIEDLLKITPNQNKWLSNFTSRLVISNIVGLTLGVLLYFFIFMKIIDSNALTDFASFLFIIFFSIFIGQLMAFIFLDRLLFKLYSTIEFDTTLEHLNKSKKIRAIILSIFMLVILPLISSFISNLLF